MARSGGKKSKSPVALISWIVGFLVVAVAALVLFSEMSVHQQYDNSFQAIGAAIGKKQISRKEVAKYLDGSPTRRKDKSGRHEWFTWGGTLQTYTFQLDYDLYGKIERIKPQ